MHESSKHIKKNSVSVTAILAKACITATPLPLDTSTVNPFVLSFDTGTSKSTTFTRLVLDKLQRLWRGHQLPDFSIDHSPVYYSKGVRVMFYLLVYFLTCLSHFV